MSDIPKPLPQVVDPFVSRIKFQKEVDDFRAMESVYRERGWYLADASYPRIVVVFGTPHLRPPLLAFGVLFDFTNYDLWPPEVTLVDPFTAVPYKPAELPTHLYRRDPIATPVPNQAGGQLRRMMIWGDANSVPFLCLPGVRAYHAHPSHTGDSWLLHRKSGAGRLYYVLDTLYRYGVQPMAMGVHIVQQIP